MRVAVPLPTSPSSIVGMRRVITVISVCYKGVGLEHLWKTPSLCLQAVLLPFLSLRSSFPPTSSQTFPPSYSLFTIFSLFFPLLPHLPISSLQSKSSCFHSFLLLLSLPLVIHYLLFHRCIHPYHFLHFLLPSILNPVTSSTYSPHRPRSLHPLSSTFHHPPQTSPYSSVTPNTTELLRWSTVTIAGVRVGGNGSYPIKK